MKKIINEPRYERTEETDGFPDPDELMPVPDRDKKPPVRAQDKAETASVNIGAIMASRQRAHELKIGGK
jgi:hypothetical protein